MCTAPAHRTTFLRKLSLVRCARPLRIARSSPELPPSLRIARSSLGRPPSLRIARSSSARPPSLRIARSSVPAHRTQFLGAVPVLAHRTQFLGAACEQVRPCASHAVPRGGLRSSPFLRIARICSWSPSKFIVQTPFLQIRGSVPRPALLAGAIVAAVRQQSRISWPAHRRGPARYQQTVRWQRSALR
jgi:hypothetical protein